MTSGPRDVSAPDRPASPPAGPAQPRRPRFQGAPAPGQAGPDGPVNPPRRAPRTEQVRRILERPAALTVPTLLSVNAAGHVLGCSARTIRRRIADGTLPAVIEHGRIMIRGDELRAYIDTLERHGPAPGVRRTRAPRRRHDFSFLTD